MLDAREVLAEASALASDLGITPDSALGKMIAELERAQAEFDARKSLGREDGTLG